MAMAQTTDSVIVLAAGRMIMGYSGARTLLRKFISIFVIPRHRTTWSAVMVAVTSLAITVGPGVNSILNNIEDFEIGPFKVRKYNIIAWFVLIPIVTMATIFLWLFQDTGIQDFNKKVERKRELKNIDGGQPDLFLLDSNSLKERINADRAKGRTKSEAEIDIDDFMGKGNFLNTKNLTETQQGLSKIYKGLFYDVTSEGIVQQIMTLENYYLTKDAGFEFDFRVGEARTLLKGMGVRRYMRTVYHDYITYYFTFFFFLVKITQEAYITEIPMVTDKYYEWDSVKVGYIWLITTVVGVPGSLLVAILSKYGWGDKKILWTTSIWYIVFLIAKINWGYDKDMNQYHYMIASTGFFLATLFSESIAVSILSKVISKQKQVGFWNAGLMSGLADTFGRAVGSAGITLIVSLTSIRAIPCVMYSFYGTICVVFLVLMALMWDKMEVCYYYDIVCVEDPNGQNMVRMEITQKPQSGIEKNNK